MKDKDQAEFFFKLLKVYKTAAPNLRLIAKSRFEVSLASAYLTNASDTWNPRWIARDSGQIAQSSRLPFGQSAYCNRVRGYLTGQSSFHLIVLGPISSAPLSDRALSSGLLSVSVAGH